MRVIFVAPPHTETTYEFSSCAFTQNMMTLCEAMTDQGIHTVMVSGEENVARCNKHVTYHTTADRERWFGVYDKSKIINIDWSDTPQWREANAKAVQALQSLKLDRGRDVIMLAVGSSQGRISLDLPDIASVDYAIGFEGAAAPYRVYCSHAWRSFLAGKFGERFGSNDTVIHHYTKPLEPNLLPDDYVLFVGRVFSGKGPNVAAQIARRAGRKLLIAGTGVSRVEENCIVLDDGSHITGTHSEIEYVGPVGPTERTALMRQAYATIVPTQYFEPFGLVVIESTMVGTPVLTTNWGAFPEIVRPEMGETFSNVAEGVRKLETLGDLNREEVHYATMDFYSTDAAVPEYMNYLSSLPGLRSRAWR